MVSFRQHPQWVRLPRSMPGSDDAVFRLGQISWMRLLGRNLYDALEVKLDKRLGGPEQLSFQLAYTWSKTMNGTSFTNSWPYEDPTVHYEISPTIAPTSSPWPRSGIFPS